MRLNKFIFALKSKLRKINIYFDTNLMQAVKCLFVNTIARLAWLQRYSISTIKPIVAFNYRLTCNSEQ